MGLSKILPEHKETIIRRQLEEGRKDRPTLDPQEIEQALAESFHEHRAVTVRLFDEYEDTELTGIVVLIHTFRQEIKLSLPGGEWQWINIYEVVSAH